MKMTSLVLGVLIILFSCNEDVQKVNPVEEKITESVYASGVVKSKNQYQVFSAVNGIVSRVMVTEGALVKKGTPIIQLSNASAQLNIESAELAAAYSSAAANAEKLRQLKVSIELARTKLENERRLYERQQNLWDQKIGTKNELEQRELSLKNAESVYESAQLNYSDLKKQIDFQERQARKNLQISKSVAGDFVIKSEVEGKVYSILKEAGEMVNIQSPVALIGDATQFQLELKVDEFDITRIKVGQKVYLQLDSYKQQVFEAVVAKINPVMNERTRSFSIDAAFTKQPEFLYPNLTCEANIVIQEKEKALLIPRSYLLSGDYVLLPDNEKRKVVTGLKDYQMVEILSGLTKKDIIRKPVE